MSLNKQQDAKESTNFMPQQPPDTSPLVQHAGQSSLQGPTSVHQTHVSLPLVGVDPTTSAVAAAAAAAAAVSSLSLVNPPAPSLASASASLDEEDTARAASTTKSSSGGNTLDTGVTGLLVINATRDREKEDADSALRSHREIDDDEEDDDEDEDEDEEDDKSKSSSSGSRGSLKRHRNPLQGSRKRRLRYDTSIEINSNITASLAQPASPNQDFFSDQEGPSCSSSIRRSITAGMNQAYSTDNNHPHHISLNDRTETVDSIPSSLPEASLEEKAHSELDSSSSSTSSKPLSANTSHPVLLLRFQLLTKRLNGSSSANTGVDSPDTLPKSISATLPSTDTLNSESWQMSQGSSSSIIEDSDKGPSSDTETVSTPFQSQLHSKIPSSAPATGKFPHIHHNIHSDSIYKKATSGKISKNTILSSINPLGALNAITSASTPSSSSTTPLKGSNTKIIIQSASSTNSNASNPKTSTSTTASTNATTNASGSTSGNSQMNNNPDNRANASSNGNNNPNNPNNNSITINTHTTIAPSAKFIRRFRSRSLPIIAYTQSSMAANQLGAATALSKFTTSSHSHSHNPHYRYKSSQVPPVPPINLQSLREIDLHEILKNPQLRHDILFDPQLQFRPNLDGERGRRKKLIIDKYWTEVQKECSQFFMNPPIPPKNIKIPRLPLLFSTLRDILLLLLPHKDRAAVNDVMDISLAVQQLQHGLFDFVSLAKWLGDVFKSHCAPMRDQWVLEMINKFEIAYSTSSVENLVSGLRMIFSILEAMKLDVANHQIRILRPVLVETAVDFEKDYFNQLINHCKIDITDSLKWFSKNQENKRERITSLMGQLFKDSGVSGNATSTPISDLEYKSVLVCSIIDLLSCRNMATEFPSTLAFDHTRLVLLRADVRQLVCVQLCICLYRQLCSLKKLAPPSATQVQRVQEEILAIVTDDNGNVKWTRNVEATSLQLVRLVDPTLPKSLIDFSYNWLIKQIQPSSEVYGLMEEKIFKVLTSDILSGLRTGSSTSATSNTTAGSVAITMSGVANASNAASGSSVPPGNSGTSNGEGNKATEMSNILNRILTLVKFHWSVFGTCYVDFLTSNNS